VALGERRRERPHPVDVEQGLDRSNCHSRGGRASPSDRVQHCQERSTLVGGFQRLREFGPKTARKLQVVRPTDLSTCDEYTALDHLCALFGLTYTTSATGSSSYRIVEYTPQAYFQTDLNMFFGNVSPTLYGMSPCMVSIDGGYAQTEYQDFNYNGESDLDLQYCMGLLEPLQMVTIPSRRYGGGCPI
jgi:hypothetical protein